MKAPVEVTIVEHEISPPDQDRPDPFYLESGWRLMKLPTDDMMAEDKSSVEDLFKAWQSLRAEDGYDAEPHQLRHGEGDPVEVHVLVRRPGADVLKLGRGGEFVALDPDGRIVRNLWETQKIGILARKWTVEMQTGSTKSVLHEGTFAACKKLYEAREKRPTPGTLVWLNPFGDVYKQKARPQFREVLSVDKLETDEGASAKFQDIVSGKRTLRKRIFGSAARVLNKLIRRLEK